MLFVISAITFLIFFGLPRLSGASPATLRRAVHRKVAQRAAEHRYRQAARLLRPAVRAVRPVGEGGRRRRRLQLRQRRRALPGAVPRLLVHHAGAGLAGHHQPVAGDALAGRRRGPHLAGRRRRRGRALGTETRKHLRPSRHGRRTGRCVAADLLHRTRGARSVQLQTRLDRARRHIYADHAESADMGVRLDLAVDCARVPLRGRPTPG